VPELLQDVDVLLLPYMQSKHSRGVIPAKTFECLATGIPTVSIGLSSLEEFAEYFYLCDTYEQVISAIEAAADEEEDLRRRRIEFARKQTWASRIHDLESMLTSTADSSSI
jgi:hypothetical protein